MPRSLMLSTVLNFHCFQKHSLILPLLIRQFLNTPLHMAAFKGHNKVVALLVKDRTIDLSLKNKVDSLFLFYL